MYRFGRCSKYFHPYHILRRPKLLLPIRKSYSTMDQTINDLYGNKNYGQVPRESKTPHRRKKNDKKTKHNDAQFHRDNERSGHNHNRTKKHHTPKRFNNKKPMFNKNNLSLVEKGVYHMATASVLDPDAIYSTRQEYFDNLRVEVSTISYPLHISSFDCKKYPWADDKIIVSIIRAKDGTAESVALKDVGTNSRVFHVRSKKDIMSPDEPMIIDEDSNTRLVLSDPSKYVYVNPDALSPYIIIDDITPFYTASHKDNFDIVVSRWEMGQEWPTGTLKPYGERKKMFTPHLSKQEIQDGLEHGDYVSGILRMNPRNYQQAFVTVEGFDRDVFIYGAVDRNRALNGDTVALKLKKKEDRRERRNNNKKKQDDNQEENEVPPVEEEVVLEEGEEPEAEQFDGEIVGILQKKKNNLRVAGYIKFDENRYLSQRALFVPFDNNVPIAFIKGQLPPTAQEYLMNSEKQQHGVTAFSLSENKPSWDRAKSATDGKVQLWVAKYDQEWLDEYSRPLCTLDKELGESGKIETETAAFLETCGIDYNSDGSFNQDVLDDVKNYSANWTIEPEELKKRVDLRDELIVSIDPSTARDLDDSLSLEILSNGNYKVGVHIADVSHFVVPGTHMDREAQHRATSVYLMQRVLPMLPHILCEELCSLNENVDRYAFSVFMKMDKNGKAIGKPTFHKSVIRNLAKLSYDDAQAMIDAKLLPNGEIDIPEYLAARKLERHSWQLVASKIRILNDIAKRSRKYRYDNGALEFHNGSMKFDLDDDGLPTKMSHYVLKESNKLIEEYMIKANVAVGDYISEKCPQFAVLRCHDGPDRAMMKEMWKRVRVMNEVLNVPIKTPESSTSGGLQKRMVEYDDMFLPGSNISAGMLLSKLLAPPLSPAEYFIAAVKDPRAWHHFALNETVYTHFTSPIRRYPDILVHRLLNACIEADKKKKPLQVNEARQVMKLDNHKMNRLMTICNTRKEMAKKASTSSQNVFLCLLINKLTEDKKKDVHIRKICIITDFNGQNNFKVICPDLFVERVLDIKDIDCKKATIDKKLGKIKITWNDNTNTEYGLFSIAPVDVKCSFGPPMNIVLRVTQPLETDVMCTTGSVE